MAARGNDFVFDDLLGYLSNPLFQVPVLSFMENNCLIFDASIEDSPEYRSIHEEYRKLVDSLLEGFRFDTKLSHEQIIQGMKDLNSNPELRQIFQELFEQVLAMDEFSIFVYLMINKNIELQKQALLVITYVHSHAHGNQQEGGDAKPLPQSVSMTMQQDEEEILKAVLEQSKLEYETQLQQMQKEEEENLSSIIIISQVESMRLDEESKKEQQKLQEIVRSVMQVGDGPTSHLEPQHYPLLPSQHVPSLKDDRISNQTNKDKGASIPPPPTYVAKNSPLQPSPPVAKSKSQQSIATVTPTLNEHQNFSQQASNSKVAAAEWLKAAEAEVKSSEAHSNAVYAAAAKMAGMSEEEYKKRAEFLKQQRDKLMEMKRREREKQLLSAASNQPSRPASARAARAALNQQEKQVPSTSNAEGDKKLAMRKAIADRIKSELLGKK